MPDVTFYRKNFIRRQIAMLLHFTITTMTSSSAKNVISDQKNNRYY